MKYPLLYFIIIGLGGGAAIVVGLVSLSHHFGGQKLADSTHLLTVLIGALWIVRSYWKAQSYISR